MNVGHELVSRLVEMSGDLERTQHVVEELLVQMSWHQLEEVLVQQREHLIPFGLVDRQVLEAASSILLYSSGCSWPTRISLIIKEMLLLVMELVERCCGVDGGGANAQIMQGVDAKLRGRRRQTVLEEARQFHTHCQAIITRD